MQHPGELLKKRFLDPLGITPYRLAKSIAVDQMRLSQIVHGKRAITAVHKHGGDIELTSELGKGTELRVQLPKSGVSWTEA